MTDPEPDDAARAEIRAYLRSHPELTLQEIVATVLREQPTDVDDLAPTVSHVWAEAGGNVDAFWAVLESDYPAVAEALKNVVLVPLIIEVARQERAPG
jgi:hypothetical protein